MNFSSAVSILVPFGILNEVILKDLFTIRPKDFGSSWMKWTTCGPGGGDGAIAGFAGGNPGGGGEGDRACGGGGGALAKHEFIINGGHGGDAGGGGSPP